MEAVPRLPMVCFELRTPTDNTSFGPKLKEYIRDFYNEDPETYSHEINQLETLRAAAVRPGRDVSGVATLKRYYCQLHFLMSRFPMTKDAAAAVHFSWRDMYFGVSFSVPDIRYEISSILYNIGALHTQLGMSDTRTTEDGMKMACTHFQCAAWAFQHLKDTYPLIEADLAPDIMQIAYHLCLAQAQECILEKSMMDNRKASIIVKVAVQVVNYYSQASSHALKQSVCEGAIGTKIYTGWRRLAKFKEIYYRCIIQLFQGIQAEEQQKMGERVAFYQLAHDTLEEAIKLSKNLDKVEMNPKQVQEALSFTMDVVEGKRKGAKNENEFIYHEEVPDRDQLPKAMGVSLVKGIPFSINDPEVSGPDIFGRLVPMKAHEASSLYSEEKAKLLRKVGGMIEEKDQLLIAFLSSLQLEYLHCYSEPNQLPQELVDRCAALSAKPNAIQSLSESMSKLSDVCTEVDIMLQQLATLLEDEDAREKEYQAVMGKRPPSIVATDMTREFLKYKEAHAKANESNEALHKVMSTHISNLRILSLPLSQLQSQIPPPPTISDPQSENIVKEMQSLMEKVEEMRNQRSMLTSQLRDSICKDDITQLLVTHQNGDMETLFQEELKKHQDIVKLIQQNLAAQDNILKAVTDAYARYSNVRKATAEAVKKRQSVINALISCFDAYEDLLAKSAKGHDFYNILETNVGKLLGRVRSTCKVQQEEREQMLVKNNSHLPQRNLSKSSNASKDTAIASATKASTTPKLKDYLKSDVGYGASLRGGVNYPGPDLTSSPFSPVGLYGQVSGQPTTYYDSTASLAANASKIPLDSQNWIPGVRPAPLGSEATTSVLKSEPSDSKAVPYLPQGTGMPQNVHPQQVYNYSGTWGYGSQASTMSTYLPTAVQYYVDKPSELPNPHQAHQYTAYSADQGYRYTPVGGVSYQNPNTLDTSFSTSQANHSFTGSYGKPSSEAIIPTSQVPDNTAAVGSYQYQQDPTYSMYQTYQPSVPVGHQYNTSAEQSSFQSPTMYDGRSAAAQAAAQANYQPPDQSGASGYSTLPGTVLQSSEQVGASGYGSNPSMYQAADSYNQQASSNYHVAGTSLNPSNVYSYDQNYQGQWPAQPASLTGNTVYQNCQIPNPSDVSQYQYMGSQNVSSYSSAGSYPTNQTSSSYSSQVQSYAYNSSTVTTSEAYYQAPPYGSQYQNVTTGNNMAIGGAVPAVQQENASPGMYMQARMPNSDSYTTDSPRTSRSSFSETSSSNVDLLAGLDFSINQQPLVPEQGQLQSKAETKDSIPIPSQHQSIPKHPEVTEKQNTLSANPESHKVSDTIIDSINDLQIQNEQVVKSESQKIPAKDPFQDLDYLHQFTQDVEKYEKFVEGLTLKTLNGPTPLDLKWKEINELQEKDAHKRSISVARCYPMKNRFPDILPYDCSRVELPSTKDDYINASHLKELTPSTPPLILTQLPLPSTYNDFWIMVLEKQVEVIVCLLSDMELEGQRYWPVEKNQEMVAGRIRLNVQTTNVKQHWTERIISVSEAETRVSRIVIHLQFTAWPGSSFPASPGPFLAFVSECLAFHSQQRVTSHPMVVHCLSGVGRTGLFCLAAASICEVQAGRGLIDLVKLTAAMSERRKAALRDREHLKFAYLSLLYYAQDCLMKCGILTCGSSFEDKRTRSEGKCHTRHPSQDFLLGPPTGLSQLQSGIEKMGLDVPSVSDHSSPNETSKRVEDSATSLSANCPSSSSAENKFSSNNIAVHLTDLSQLKVPSAPKDVKPPRYTAESFKMAGEGQLAKPSSDCSDPFNEIDPLWPLKRK